MDIVITPRTVATLHAVIAAERRLAAAPADYQRRVWLQLALEDYAAAVRAALAR